MNILESIWHSIEVSVFEHFASDLIATILIFVSMYLWGQKKRAGFILNSIACALWVFWHAQWGSVFGVLMNFGLIFMNIWGWMKWQKK